MQELIYRKAPGAASTTWSITHNFADHPVVDVYLADGRKIFPKTVVHTSPTVMTLTFTSPQAGWARLVGPKLLPLTLVDTGDMTDRFFVTPEAPAEGGQVNEFFLYPAGGAQDPDTGQYSSRFYVFTYNPITQQPLPLDAPATLTFTNADPGTEPVNPEWPNPLSKFAPGSYTVNNNITLQLSPGDTMVEINYPFSAPSAPYDRALPLTPVSTTYRSFSSMETKWAPLFANESYEV